LAARQFPVLINSSTDIPSLTGDYIIVDTTLVTHIPVARKAFIIFGEEAIEIADTIDPRETLSRFQVVLIVLVIIRLDLKRIIPVSDIMTVTFVPADEVEK
jgi:hypothetical protein